jgi:hypothetical protein
MLWVEVENLTINFAAHEKNNFLVNSVCSEEVPATRGGYWIKVGWCFLPWKPG